MMTKVLAFCLSLLAVNALANDGALKIVSRQEAVFTTPPVPDAPGTHARAVAAPLLGNGDLGVCVTGKPDNQEYWITKNDFWWLKNGQATPLNFGTMRVAVPALAGARYSVRQTLVDAMTVGQFTGRESAVTMTSFVAATANVLVMTLANEGKPVEVEVSVVPNTFRDNREERLSGGNGGVNWATRAFTQGVDIPTRATVAWRLTGTDSAKFTLQPGKPVTVMLAMASNFDAEDTHRKACSILAGADVAMLEKAHKAWWRDFHGRSFVEIPDAAIMRRYYLSQYTMACASRNPKFPPAIIGPWTTSPTGWCGYWMNYNHAAPFYGLYSSNHIEQADPQDAPVLDFMPVGLKHASEILRCRGVLYPVGIGPLGLDASGLEAPTVTNKRYEKGVCTWGQRSNTAYNLINMGWRWYATYDNDYGRKIYPFAKAVAEFWEDYLSLENGRYVINDESVHEGSGKNKNPISTLGLVRNTYLLMLDLSKELNLDVHRRDKWQDIITRLAPYPTRKMGPGQKPIFVLADNPAKHWSSNTVHIQHIYPAGAIGLDSSASLLTVARDTLAAIPRWHDLNGANSFFPAAARVGFNPRVILRELRRYSTTGMSPNGFSARNPHGIENCSTVPNTVNEMLMQSHEGVIRFFPCWPKDQNARFGTLRARGAFLVSAELKDGVVTGVKIVSEKGRDCTVQNPWPSQTIRVIRNGQPDETLTGNRVTFRTTAGETIHLTKNGD